MSTKRVIVSVKTLTVLSFDKGELLKFCCQKIGEDIVKVGEDYTLKMFNRCH